ncbi:E3 ubiquitin-protein ligase DCST1-like [Tubulanus polymorphus]|uniref:E3 ubiquitin-protein ligase DCST1-like n=1 Tax=Tubulanus polymorphus TaxID=672921 RepID=UPI003DA216BD
MSSCARFLDKIHKGISSCCQKSCPLIHDFLTSEPNKYRIAKKILGFPVGALIALCLHFALIEPMQLPDYLRYSLGGVMGLLLAFGFALSVEIRCITSLLLPHLFAKSGRAYVWTFAIGLIITGPVSNLIFNAKEITRSLNCVVELAENQTKMRMELRSKPAQDILDDLKLQSNFLTGISGSLFDEFLPLNKFVTSQDDVDRIKIQNEATKQDMGGADRNERIDNRYKIDKSDSDATQDEKLFKRKLDYQCQEVFNQGVIMCKNSMKEVKVACLQKVGRILGKLLCWPFSAFTGICKLALFLPGITGIDCNSMEAVNPGFGEGFEATKHTMKDLNQQFKVNMQYKLEMIEPPVEVKTAAAIAKEIEYQFEMRTRVLNFILLTIRRILPFMFVRIFLSAMYYHNDYIKMLTFDNVYMTTYFRHIEERRRKKNKQTLMPLKKREAAKVIEPIRMRLMGPEKRKLVMGTLYVLLRALMFAGIFMVDAIVFSIMDILAGNAAVKYTQKGFHQIGLKVYGNGLVGNLVRTLFKSFNQQHSIDNLTSNEVCLPRPMQTPRMYIWKTIAVVVTVWVSILTEAYALRLRRVIASFFYRKHEKKRILFLYNDMMRKRNGYMKHMRAEIRAMVERQELSRVTSLLTALKLQFPRLCCCLNVLGLGKRKCIVCDEREDSKCVTCTKGCNFLYCAQCWIDAEGQCYICDVKKKDVDAHVELKIDDEF